MAVRKKLNTQYFLDATRPSGWKPFSLGKSVASKLVTLGNKYSGADYKGMNLVQTVVEARAAFIAGAGLSVKEVDDARQKATNDTGEVSEEMRIVQETIKWNNLDREMLYSYAIEAELEGRLLFLIERAESDTNEVPDGAYNLRHLPWAQYRYSVKMKDADKSLIDHIEYQGDNGKTVELKPGEFVYKTFGSGRYHDLNGALPRAACCLEDIEAAHCARNDLRESNHLFAHPTPVFKVSTKNDVAPLQKALQDAEWKIGTMLCTNAEFSIVGVDTGGTSVLLDEIKATTQRISGSTGVPIFFLGYTEALTNRSTAWAILEALDVNVRGERARMETLFNEIIYAVINQRNDETGGNLDPQAIVATIPAPWIIQQQYTEVADHLLQLYREGALSLRTLLSTVCHVKDVDKEIRSIAAEALSMKTQTRGEGTVDPAAGADLRPAVEGLIDGIGDAVIKYLGDNLTREVLQA